MRLIVFDCDGTLVDSQQAIVSATSEAFEVVGVAVPTREDILSAVGLPLKLPCAATRRKLTTRRLKKS